jgi:hypothetical protein
MDEGMDEGVNDKEFSERVSRIVRECIWSKKQKLILVEESVDKTKCNYKRRETREDMRRYDTRRVEEG